MVKLKRININDCVYGQKYYVECGIWKGNFAFAGHTHHPRKYTFTAGPVAQWNKQFNIVAAKSNLKVYEILNYVG